MKKNQNPNQTNAAQVRKQNQQSQQQTQFGEEFGSETDVQEVQKQVQQAETNKRNASGQLANKYQNGSK